MPSWRSIVVAIVCSSIVMLQLLGVHLHVMPEQAAEHVHAATAMDHHDGHVIVSDYDLDHEADHFEAGAADIDVLKAPGKGAQFTLLFALLLAFPILLLSTRRLQIRWPETHRVLWPSRRYLTPPSQAPPLAG